ncbi:hypothetical protein [Chryseobacterium sp. JV274]
MRPKQLWVPDTAWYKYNFPSSEYWTNNLR